SMAVGTSWISKKPDRCGGVACVRDTRITVWGLVAYRRLGMSDPEILGTVQGLSSADLEAAWEYALEHPEEIDESIRANEEGEEGFGERGRMQLYADEVFSFPVVLELRQLGYDVLTAQEDGRSSTADADILARALFLGRSVLTYNRRHFERLP